MNRAAKALAQGALLLGIPVTVGMAGWGVWFCSAQIVDHEPLTDNAIGVVAVLWITFAVLLGAAYIGIKGAMRP